MSMHLTHCAAVMPIPASAKLVLMAFADSADDYTHLSFPGHEKIQLWASVGRSQSADLVVELVGLGLLKKHRAGRRGRRAEYIVFPRGCCPLHPRHVPDEDADAVAGDSIEGSATPDPEHPTAPATPAPNPPAQKGSGAPESASGTGSGTPDPNGASAPGSATPDPSRGKHPESIRPTGPLPLQEQLPPQPPASGGSQTSTECQRPGQKPHANCRACGTTNKLQREAAERTARERRRAEEAEAWAAESARRKAAALTPEEVSARARQAREEQLSKPMRSNP